MYIELNESQREMFALYSINIQHLSFFFSMANLFPPYFSQNGRFIPS